MEAYHRSAAAGRAWHGGGIDIGRLSANLARRPHATAGRSREIPFSDLSLTVVTAEPPCSPRRSWWAIRRGIVLVAQRPSPTTRPCLRARRAASMLGGGTCGSAPLTQGDRAPSGGGHRDSTSRIRDRIYAGCHAQPALPRARGHSPRSFGRLAPKNRHYRVSAGEGPRGPCRGSHGLGRLEQVLPATSWCSGMRLARTRLHGAWAERFAQRSALRGNASRGAASYAVSYGRMSTSPARWQ